jgi:diaminohydroxyphosphoribosylaminopyrimidine deaminase/5-amino-6-(5-phosphoribosylamino)uracil reductase
MLRSAGIVVDVLPRSDDANRDTQLDTRRFQQLIAPFTLGFAGRRPYVTLKWAQTADGTVAAPGGRRLAISGAEADRFVHRLRTLSDRIVIGVSTAIADDPELTVRHMPIVRRPTRVVIDRSLRIPLNSRLVRTARQVPTLAICLSDAAATRQSQLIELGIEVRPVAEVNLLEAGLGTPAESTHTLVEPGPTLARLLLDSNRCDRLIIIESSKRAGTQSDSDDTERASMSKSEAPAAATIPRSFVDVSRFKLGDDLVREMLNRESAGFFSPMPSPESLERR